MKKGFIVLISVLVVLTLSVVIIQLQPLSVQTAQASTVKSVNRETITPSFGKDMIAEGDSFTVDFSLGNAISSYDYDADSIDIISFGTFGRNGLRAVLSAKSGLGKFKVYIDATDKRFYGK